MHHIIKNYKISAISSSLTLFHLFIESYSFVTKFYSFVRSDALLLPPAMPSFVAPVTHWSVSQLMEGSMGTPTLTPQREGMFPALLESKLLEEAAKDLMHLHTTCLSGVDVAAALRVLTPLQHAALGFAASPVTKERQGLRSKIA